MREQLIKYVELLFAGSPDAADVRQEILQNTLDRYDDLIAQGKTPEAAYSLAISGIGDVSEIIGSPTRETPVKPKPTAKNDTNPEDKKRRAVAIAVYIVSPIPLFALSEAGYATLGLCMLLILVAAATALLIMAARENEEESAAPSEKASPEPGSKSSLRRQIARAIRTTAFVLFFIISFATDAWHNTWLIFPIAAAVKGLVNAILDLKEDNRNET